MANEAQKEPTMEEILASIRKIISDDDPAVPARKADAKDTMVSFPEDDAEEEFEALDLSASDDDLDDVMFDDEAETEEEAFEAEIGAAESEAEDTMEPPSFEEMLGAARAAVAAPQAEESFEDFAPEMENETIPEVAPESATPQPVAATVEDDMQSSAKYQETVLTDDNTADAAAGALGKLISRMDMGGNNTIEALVREMLKPMMKEWLDANLAKIVEEKVEAEVQRIARMAR